jgi:hypothetical protein
MKLHGFIQGARPRRLWIMPAGLFIGLFGLSPHLRAAVTPVTFAQVTESSANSSANVFAYLDNSATTGDAELGTDVGGVFGAAVPADFTFLTSGLPADLQGVQDATISMTSSTVTPVAPALGFGEYAQSFTGLGQFTDVVSITRDTPAAEGNGSRTNLLTMIFTGPLEGRLGGTTPSLSGNTSLGDTVTFTSDFMTFTSAAEEDFNMAFSSWNPQLTLAGDGNFNTASAAAASTFDFGTASVATPEPAALPWFVMAIGLALTRVRRRTGHRSHLTSAAI